MKALWRLFGAATAVAVLVGMAAAPASAGLTLHLRLPYVEAHPGETEIPDADEYGMDYLGAYSRAAGAPAYVTDEAGAAVHRGLGGTDNGGAVEIVSDTQEINLQLWAVVTGGNGTGDDEGLKRTMASVLSSKSRDTTGVHDYDPPNDPGLVYGDLTADWGLYKNEVIPGMIYQWVTNDAFNAFPPKITKVGTEQDLDGDGDVDVGYTQDESGDFDSDGDTYPDTGHFWTAEGQGVFDKAPGEEHLLTDMTFNVTGWGPEHVGGGRCGVTYIWARPGHSDLVNIWREDGDTIMEIPDFDGEPIILYVASGGETDTPAGQKVGPGQTLELDGTAATGSVNWWKWVFNGGDYEIAGTDKEDIDVEFGELEPVLGLGDHTVKMVVGWEGSPLILTGESGDIPFTLLPEPATLALVGVGLVVLARRKRK